MKLPVVEVHVSKISSGGAWADKSLLKDVAYLPRWSDAPPPARTKDQMPDEGPDDPEADLTGKEGYLRALDWLLIKVSGQAPAPQQRASQPPPNRI